MQLFWTIQTKNTRAQTCKKGKAILTEGNIAVCENRRKQKDILIEGKVAGKHSSTGVWVFGLFVAAFSHFAVSSYLSLRENIFRFSFFSCLLFFGPGEGGEKVALGVGQVWRYWCGLHRPVAS